MKTAKLLLPAVLLLLAGQIAAQSNGETGTAESREAEITRRLAEAEARMAAAARQIAELTTERLPNRQFIERRIEMIDTGRPRLGVTIGGDDAGPVEGVRIIGVTPGSAASGAGLRAGDIITSINGDSLSAENAEVSNRALLDFMEGIEEGDTLDIEYLRDGKVGTVEIEPRRVDVNVFAFRGDGGGLRMPSLPGAHGMPHMPDGAHDGMAFNWISGNSWGDMELVELNEGLGRYFGTAEGLLVVSAPKSNSLQLEDGDVIQKIDGRAPSSVRHAMRILGSYQSGETLKLDIMRDKKRRTLDVEMPDDRSSMLTPAPAVRPASAPALRAARVPTERT